VKFKGQFVANPNPPRQHSLWEETGVPTTFDRVFTDSFHTNVMSPQQESTPPSQEVKGGCFGGLAWLSGLNGVRKTFPLQQQKI
jgi:hypothetical protein